MRTRVHGTGKEGLERSRARRTQRCCGEKSPLSEGVRLDISWQLKTTTAIVFCVCMHVCVCVCVCVEFVMTRNLLSFITDRFSGPRRAVGAACVCLLCP